ncbi:uncharacterized protein LOC119573500 [Penaeus monodon]|uniref:uncharacterized protein LOC119573500 n=1 Tax=Penaeus monodon TaxID=6687 RepID=UPI0018A767C2|nr:uncharacterized protein LOC119573500 [Penaeus monodon]
MHVAAWQGHWGALEALAASGADVDPIDDAGNTPLHDAASSRQLLAVGVLTGLGVSTRQKNKGGETPQDLLGKPSADELLSMVMTAGNQIDTDQGWAPWRSIVLRLRPWRKGGRCRLVLIFPKVPVMCVDAEHSKKCKNGKTEIMLCRDKFEEQQKEMKRKYDSKEAEAANLQKKIGKINKERKKEIKLLQDKLEEQQKEMKKYDSKEAEAANLQKENTELKKDLHEKEKEIKLIQVCVRDTERERRE